MRFGSVCSGIEAASVAWHPLGWRAAWFAEVDPAASAVLAHRFPDVVNHGDMVGLIQKVLDREIEAPDVLVGGTPCQSFSVAGKRAGLADIRGQLTLAFVLLADAIDQVRTERGEPPCIIIWENVPGALSSKDNAFGCLLAGLAGESDPVQPAGRKWTNAGAVLGPERAVAWRVLDAQYFGLAQRRRRVFAVASARQGFDPTEVLFERGGVRRDSAPRRPAGESATHDAAPCLTSSGRGVERTGDPRGQDPDDGVLARQDSGVKWPAEIASTLNAHFGDKWGLEDQHVNSGCPLFIPHPVSFGSKGALADCGPLAPTLRASGHDESHANGGRTPAVAYAIQERAICENPAAGPDGVGVRSDDCAYTMEARTVPQAVAYAPPVCVTGEVTHTLRAEGYDASEDGTGRGNPITTFIDNIVMLVRRLMPVECERLQGFPDDWTRIPVRHYATKKVTKTRPEDMWIEDPNGGWWLTAADGPRYKQLGNSMAVKVMNWIGRRAQMQFVATDFDEVLG